MLRNSFISSAILHGLVLTMMAMDFSFARFDKTPPPPAIMMVDLTKVKISNKTNLPPQKTPTKKKTQPVQKPAVKSTKALEKKAPEPPKPIPQTPVKNAVPVIQKEEKVKKDSKKKPTKTTAKAEPSANDQLKSLLASVDKVKRSAPVSAPVEPEDDKLTEGIDGGTEGSYSQILSISDTDLIRSQLSKCWNLDAGKKDIDDTIIEIRALVNKDGTIRDVKILTSTHDTVFRSVAESAKRAVYVCAAKGDDSPFKMLADKYADHYGDWKSLLLRFNPKTGGLE